MRAVLPALERLSPKVNPVSPSPPRNIPRPPSATDLPLEPALRLDHTQHERQQQPTDPKAQADEQERWDRFRRVLVGREDQSQKVAARTRETSVATAALLSDSSTGTDCTF